ncbi:methyltransferase domain-containing protein [Trichocoleus desertorum AS-A10]|uniref:class I SAM-dependent methyltransferase n=1 Tax=Trichocoleus desertorum TaxID=1481672 RepID=UPI003296DDD6
MIKSFIPKYFRDRHRYKWRNFELFFYAALGKVKRQFIRPPFPDSSFKEINLHLGCGSIDRPEFINIDGLAAPHIHYVRAIDNLAPFKSNSVNLIYASHCLEHFPYAQVPFVLSEWYRVLKEAGILRISVPDFDLLLRIYEENNRNPETVIYPLMGYQSNKLDVHMSMFNKSNLTSLLKEAGFAQVEEWQPGSDQLTTFDDWSSRGIVVNSRSYQISLNLQAVK